ncbi:MAG: long-chain fatty acid--CoA ligase [Burkholderiaceae bacterium]|nr:long-chain fatty acid--CoA ligase [Burkholderiaceae bacterium]
MSHDDPAAIAAMRSSRPPGRGAVRAYDWIAHHRAHRPAKEAVRELASQRSHSYADLDRRADALAAYLGSLGIVRGDRVALLAHNGVEFFDLQFACMRTGAIAVLLNWRLTVSELEYIVNDSSPRLLIHDAEFGDTAQALQARCGIGALLRIDARAAPAANPYESIVEAFSGQPVTREPLTHDDVVTIMYTSGTTGHPKGAMITHGMNFWNCVNLGLPAGVGQDTVHLSVLPLFHTGGLNCYSNPVLHAGGTVVIMRSFDPGQALQVIGDPAQGISHFFAVPAPYQFMIQHPDFATTDLGRLRSAGVGGAPCALSILQAWADRGVRLMQGFGMTETSPACIFLDPADAMRKLGSTGKVLMHTEARIVDETGGDCGPNQIGELWVAGPNITPGYWNRPDATAASFEGRWLKTGDAARCDDEGFFYIVDRWKDMYISGGENVYPAEVENVLYQLPQVAEAAVIGVPSDKWGEVGLAVLALKPGQPLDRDAVIGHCSGRLARFKWPHDVAFVDALPRNATGKVLKRELRKRFVGSGAPAIT